MNTKTIVKLTSTENACLKAMLASANALAPDRRLSLSELVNVAIVNADTCMALMGDGAFRMPVVIMMDATRRLMPMLDNNMHDVVPTTFRDVAIDDDNLATLEGLRNLYSKKWCLKRTDDSEYLVSLEGEVGLSRLIFSLALSYLVISRFKLVHGGDSLEIPRRTKIIEVGDHVRFLLVSAYLFAPSYTEGKAQCRVISIDFVDNLISSGKVTTLSIDEKRVLEKDVVIDQPKQEQNAPEIDDPEIEEQDNGREIGD